MPKVIKLVRQCEISLQALPGLRRFAVVEDGDAVDVACVAPPGLPLVVRCVEQATRKDHTALATMISEGDFVYGAVVYEQGEPPHSPSLIESFHVSQLDQLVARLIELREACGEAG